MCRIGKRVLLCLVPLCILPFLGCFLFGNSPFYMQTINKVKKHDNSEMRYKSRHVLESIQFVTRRYDTTIFLIEPSVLRAVLFEKNRVNSCTMNCSYFDGLDVITFGMVRGKKDTLDSIFRTLMSHGFASNCIKDKEVITHIIIQHNIHMTPIGHIVVFDKISHGYLWHSQLLSSGHALSFAKKPGIYKNFTFAKHYLDGIQVFTPSPIISFLKGMQESDFIECNSSRAFSFHEKYPEFSKNTNFQRVGIRVFTKVRKVFTDLGIPFVLASGSLLGWYRQCDILPYGDFDIQMFPADYTPKIINALQKEGLRLISIFGKLNDSFELSFRMAGIKLDIFMVYEEGNMFWHPAIVPRTGKKFKFVFPKFTMCWTTLHKILVQIPCNVDKVIQAFYGKNWEIPVKKWHFVNNIYNVEPNGFWPRHEWKDVIQKF